jgi:small subunit ribosomal protein S29
LVVSRFPVLISVDHVQAYFRPSEYLTPELHKLESYHLSVPRLFLDIISGRTPIHRGLTILAASPLDTHYRISPELLHGIGLQTNEHLLGEFGTFSKENYPGDPNKQLQMNHVENARAIELVKVPEGFTVEEARGLWEAKVVRRTMHTGQSSSPLSRRISPSGLEED